MNMINNLWKVADSILSVLSKVIFLLCVVYGFYVMCTPGFYGFLVVYICMILLYTFLTYKFTKWIKQKDSKYNSEELIERRYACTYRKRYYSNIYIIALVIVCIFLISNTCMIINRQMDKELTNQYIESIEYMLGEDTNEVIIMKKVSPLIPNSSKKAMIYGTECFRLADELAEFIVDAKAKGSIDKEQVERYKERAEVLSNKIDIEVQSTKYELTYIMLTLLFLKLAMKDLKTLLRHRSIELT